MIEYKDLKNKDEVSEVKRDGAWQQVTGHPEVHKL